ncbi:MAG: class II fructose-bisphosphate aldolase [Candidatus Levyibacteriota bacterium]
MSEDIDRLIKTAVFSEDSSQKEASRKEIRTIANNLGINLASINGYYMAIGSGKVPPSSTVPAINVRAMTYDTARVVFGLMLKHKIGPVIFEISRTEIEYTSQRPDEYATVVLAAAIKEGYKGPVFVQGDHFQFSANRYKEDPNAETEKIKALIKEAVDAGFMNIDIDASTLVDLSKPTPNQQQVENYKATSILTEYIRSLEKDTTISVGAEIGHIGDRNSTTEDLDAFMQGYVEIIGNKMPGISKVSIQTGTSHGGIPLPDGKIADVKLDFSVIEDVGKLAREKYCIGGVVQHGASTLPNELFGEFPKHHALEIHLATGFQNIVYNNMPVELKREIYKWLEENCKDEWEKDWNNEQFVYKLRKKATGPFKKKMWELSEVDKKPIIDALEKQFEFLFEKLNIFNTKDTVLSHIKTASSVNVSNPKF